MILCSVWKNHSASQNGMTHNRRLTLHVFNTLMLLIALIALLAALGLVIGSLTHAAREHILNALSIGLLVAPATLLAIPRTYTWAYWVTTGWAFLLGVRYAGDMGADGHMFTAAFESLAACWATFVGLLIMFFRKHIDKGKTHTPLSLPHDRRKLLSAACLFVLMICSVAFLCNRVLAEIHRSEQQAQFAAPFHAAGMRVYFDASGDISIQCSRARFGNAELLSVINELRQLENLKILNLSFTAITDESIHELASLHDLEYLELYETNVTDIALDHLAAMQQLEWLDVRNTDVTDEGIAQLKEALPNCLVL
jgi:Leucine-rich repeat (LRR) protein